MNYKLFDPTACKPEDYRSRYPELKTYEVFNELTNSALIFVWWYSNPTSEFVMNEPDHKRRVLKALEKSNYNPSRQELDRIKKLKFDDKTAQAIDKMSNFDPGSRFKAWRMLNTIMNQYMTIIEQGEDEFTEIKKEFDAEGREIEIKIVDHQKYVTVTSKISEAIPGLLDKLESGFGIVVKGGDEDEDDYDNSMRDWHMGKQES